MRLGPQHTGLTTPNLPTNTKHPIPIPIAVVHLDPIPNPNPPLLHSSQQSPPERDTSPTPQQPSSPTAEVRGVSEVAIPADAVVAIGPGPGSGARTGVLAHHPINVQDVGHAVRAVGVIRVSAGMPMRVQIKESRYN